MKSGAGSSEGQQPSTEDHHAETERPQEDEEYRNRKGSWRPSFRPRNKFKGKGYDRRPQASTRYQPGRGKGRRPMGKSNFGRFNFKGKNRKGKGKGKKYGNTSYGNKNHSYGQMYATFPTTSTRDGDQHGSGEGPAGFVPTNDSDDEHVRKHVKPKAGKAYQMMFGPDPSRAAQLLESTTTTTPAMSSSGMLDIRKPPGLQVPLYVPLTSTSLDAPRICHSCWRTSTFTCVKCQKR